MKNILIPALFILTSGCTYYNYYAPNSANIPLFKEKNTFEIKTGIGGGKTYDGGDIQMAYSATPRIGVMLNSFFAGSTHPLNFFGNNENDFATDSYVESGIGYYYPFGNDKEWIWETYAGGGIGGQNHSYSNTESSQLSVGKFFVQPSVGFHSINGNIECAVSSRFSHLKLKVKGNTILSSNTSDKQDIENIVLKPNSFLWEPSVMVAGGWKNFKVFFQFTFSENLSSRYLNQAFTNAEFGIKFTFKTNAVKKNKQTNNDNYITPSTD